MNHLGVSENVNSDYFFSRQGSIWGVATWKRVIDERNNFCYSQDPYVMELLRQRTKHNKKCWDRLNAYANQDYFEGHVAGSEFWIEFQMYAQNRLQIIPKFNLISNIGCTNSSEHSDDIKQLPHGIRRVFNMETYELSFPLKHAEYVIPDVQYEIQRNRIMGYNTPIVHFFRNVELFFIRLFSGKLFFSIKKRISRNNKLKSGFKTEN